MKSKLIIAIMCIVALLASSGCIAAKTVTQTVAATTVTQWTASTTVTQTVPSVSLVTIPAVTNIVTQAPVTTTVTAPPVTSTVIQPMVTTVTSPPITNTVTSPPVTSTVTTPPVTTTVTYTPTVPPTTIPPSLAITASISYIGGGFATIDGANITTEQPITLILQWKNNTDVNYNSVQFKLTMLTESAWTQAPNYPSLSVIGATTPTWFFISPTAGSFNFINIPNISIAANETGIMYLTLKIKLSSVIPAGFRILAQSAIAN
jgi:hypothetical protein